MVLSTNCKVDVFYEYRLEEKRMQQRMEREEKEKKVHV